MIGRLLKGVILGLIVGGLTAFGLFKWLGILTFGIEQTSLLAYASAVVVGALLGLLAGKPIWAKGAKIEALLKTAFGAALATGGMFLLHKFAGFDVNLSSLGLPAGKLYDIPALALPAIAVVLGSFFEVDNTDAPKEQGGRVDATAAPKLRAPAPKHAADDADDRVEEPAAPRKAKR